MPSAAYKWILNEISPGMVLMVCVESRYEISCSQFEDWMENKNHNKEELIEIKCLKTNSPSLK